MDTPKHPFYFRIFLETIQLFCYSMTQKTSMIIRPVHTINHPESLVIPMKIIPEFLEIIQKVIGLMGNGILFSECSVESDRTTFYFN